MDIKEAERRAKRYFYDDGLTETAVGIMFLLFGGYFFSEAVFPDGNPVKEFLNASFVLLIICAGFLFGRVIRFLKFRITYPRTGYVSYKKKELSPARRRAAALLSAFVAMAVATLLAKSPSFRVWLPALNGLLGGIAVYLLARRTEVGRFYVLAGASVIIGFAIALAGFGDIKGLGLYYAAFGAALIVSGLASLVIYLRRSRGTGEGAHES